MNARRDRWGKSSVATQLGLIEDDQDIQEGNHSALVIRLDEELKWMRRTMIGLLITITGCAIGVCFTIILVGRG